MAFFMQGLALGFPAAMSPGPFLAYLLGQTLKLGPRRALPLALVPLLSDGPIVTLVLLVLTQMPAGLLRGLQLVGGLWLLYLAYGAFRPALQAVELNAAAATQAAPRSVAQGVLLNLFNPNPWLFWSVVGGPLVIEAWRQTPALAASFLAGFYLTLIGGSVGFILLFAAAHRLGPRLSRALNLLSAAALLIFGVIQLARGLIGP